VLLDSLVHGKVRDHGRLAGKFRTADRTIEFLKKIVATSLNARTEVYTDTFHLPLPAAVAAEAVATRVAQMGRDTEGI